MNNLRIIEIRSQYQIRLEDVYGRRRAGLGKEWNDVDRLYLRFRAAGLTLQATVGQVLSAMYLKTTGHCGPRFVGDVP